MEKAVEPTYVKVRRPQNDEWNPKFFTRTVKYGKYSAMVWGGISYSYKTELLVFDAGEHIDAQRYM